MDDLIKLRQKKIRQKLRYLQLELMEAKIIYKNSLQKFHKDFSQDIKPDKKNKEKVDIKDPYEEIQTEVSTREKEHTQSELESLGAQGKIRKATGKITPEEVSLDKDIDKGLTEFTYYAKGKAAGYSEADIAKFYLNKEKYKT